jgi:hypothetical protein
VLVVPVDPNGEVDIHHGGGPYAAVDEVLLTISRPALMAARAHAALPPGPLDRDLLVATTCRIAVVTRIFLVTSPILKQFFGQTCCRRGHDSKRD